MKNHFLVGSFTVERLLELAQPPFLLIDDGPLAEQFLSHTKAKLFDVTKHHFNPLRGMDYKRARDFAATLYSASPEGESTLTVRNGRRALVQLLLAHPARLDKLRSESSDPGTLEALATIQDLLVSPVLQFVLCRDPGFSFTGSVVVKLDRAVIGDFDAFVLASLIIGHHKGTVIVPDFGFYGRDFYMSLIRQNRLIAGLQFLSETTPALQQALLSIKDKTIYRTSPEDAKRLVIYTQNTEASTLVDQAEGKFLTSI